MRRRSPGRAPAPPGSPSTTAGTSIRELNPGDLTAVVEAGLPLAELAAATAAEGQMLALDPPLGPGERATIGGAVATNDSGPLRHRYGSARDLVVGITVALSDGTVAKAGGKVIKNVAGYDLAKLFTGSFGTLGAILDLSLRLHPLPPATATAIGHSGDPAALAAAAAAAEPRADRAAEPRRALGGRGRRRARALRRGGPADAGAGGRAGAGRRRPERRRDRRRRGALGRSAPGTAVRGRDRREGLGAPERPARAARNGPRARRRRGGASRARPGLGHPGARPRRGAGRSYGECWSRRRAWCSTRHPTCARRWTCGARRTRPRWS